MEKSDSTILDTLETKDTTSNNFRLQNQKMILTYKSHLDKKLLLEHINTTFPNYLPKYVFICHEIGSTGYHHTHVLIDWSKTFQSKNIRVFDYQHIHPNIKIIKTFKHWTNCLDYLGKQDEETAQEIESLGLTKKKDVDDPDFAKKVWSNKTLGEAVVNNITKKKDLSLLQGLIQLYKLKNSISDIPIPELKYTWQDELAKELNGTPHIRNIIWYYDEIGGSGKSEFVSNRCLTESDKYYSVNSGTSSYHLSTIVQNALANGWNSHCFFFDFPRQVVDRKNIYESIECIKSGSITAVKYMGETVRFKKPHVVVFANFLPDIHAMSIDRWDIREIKRDNSLDLSHFLCYQALPLNINTVKNLIAQKEKLDMAMPYPGLRESLLRK